MCDSSFGNQIKCHANIQHVIVRDRNTKHAVDIVHAIHLLLVHLLQQSQHLQQQQHEKLFD